MPLKSFIEVSPDSHFPLENLPFGVFQPRQGKPRVGVAVGDLIIDLSALEELGHFQSSEFRNQKVFSEDSLNSFLRLGRPAWRKTREILQHLLSADTPILRDDARLREKVFHAQKDVAMKVPARIGNYTDFYSSYHHAHNVGTMLRGPENALMPNWKWLPVAYHGRAQLCRCQRVGCAAAERSDESTGRKQRRHSARARALITNWKWRFSSGQATR